MSSIRKDSDVSEVAALVSEVLEGAGITAVLSGGAAVSIYTDNAFSSDDLDFVSSAPLDKIEDVLADLGFVRGPGRYFTHPDTAFVLEFPPGPLAFGDEPARAGPRLKTAFGAIRIVDAGQCVMDRLAAFYHWNDPQGLDQAVAVAKSHDIDIDAVRDWSGREGHADKFRRFLDLLKKT